MPPPDELQQYIRQSLAYRGFVDPDAVPDEVVQAVAEQVRATIAGFKGARLDLMEVVKMLMPLAGDEVDFGQVARVPSDVSKAVSVAEITALEAMAAPNDVNAAWRFFEASRQQGLSPQARFTLSQQKNEALAAWTRAAPQPFMDFLFQNITPLVQSNGELALPAKLKSGRPELEADFLQSLALQGRLPSNPSKEWWVDFEAAVSQVERRFQMAQAAAAAVSRGPAGLEFPFGPQAAALRRSDFLARVVPEAVASFQPRAPARPTDQVLRQAFLTTLQASGKLPISPTPEYQKYLNAQLDNVKQQWEAAGGQSIEEFGAMADAFINVMADEEQVLAVKQEVEESKAPFAKAFLAEAGMQGRLGQKPGGAVDAYLQDQAVQAERDYVTAVAGGDVTPRKQFIQQYLSKVPSVQQIETQFGPTPPGFGNLEGAVEQSVRGRQMRESGLALEQLERLRSQLHVEVDQGNISAEEADRQYEVERARVLPTPFSVTPGGVPQDMGTDIMGERFAPAERRLQTEVERVRQQVLQEESGGRSDFLRLLEQETQGAEQQYRNEQFARGREAGASTLSSIPQEFLGTPAARQTVQSSFESTAFDPGGFRAFLKAQIGPIKAPILAAEAAQAKKAAEEDLFKRQNRPQVTRVRRIV